MNLGFKFFKKPISNYVGAITFALIFFNLFQTDLVILNPYLFIFKSLKIILIIYLFLVRDSAEVTASKPIKLISYLSAFLPMVYESNLTNSIFSIKIFSATLFFSGEFLSFAGLITLGNSFGVSPAKRKNVYHGVYRYLKHPIYLGYALSEFSILISNFSIFNVIIFIFSISLYIFRSYFENNFRN